jgi:hypothetical protein
MSIIVSNTSIYYGQTSTINIVDLTNVTVEPNESVIEIVPEGNNYIAIVKPNESTLYYISGYNAFQAVINLNTTVYVKTTVSKNIIETDYNYPIKLDAYGVVNYSWYPSTYLDITTGSSVTCTPLQNITYTVIGVDKFLTTTRNYIEVIVNSGLTFTPEKPNVYSGNLLNLNVAFTGDSTVTNSLFFDGENITVSNNSLTYTWKKSLFNGLPNNCVDLKYGDTITLHPYESQEYTVNAYNNGTLLTSGNIKINVLQKPANIIDTDILPYEYYNLIISRNRKELAAELIKNKVLSQKIIKFYYTTLQTAYRMEWTDKNGIQTTVNWTTLYQIVNKSNVMILTFEQQWRFFQYINYNQRRNDQTLSNFAFLLNVVNSIYLEYPQKIYYIQQ